MIIRTISYLFLFGGVLTSYLGCQMKPQEAPKPVPALPASVPAFDGERAFSLLVKQTDFGPRVPNTDAHRNCLQFLTMEFGKYADTVYTQPFTHTGYDRGILYFSNVIASWNLSAQRRVMLCAHWDSRPWADQDPDPANHGKPVPGANDGASGVAVLLELARLLHEHPQAIGIDIVLFDGEDYGKVGDLQSYLLGSKYFARHKPPSITPEFAILLDMVGDAQLEIPKEQYSIQSAPDIVNLVWSVAREVGSTAFIDAVGEAVYDDHISLHEVGIRAIDIIDFSYPDHTHRYWHTVDDTADKCSPESLGEIGRVLLHLIYRKMQ
jgi:glutaminyl-peptide cyclotransferase